MHSLSVVIFALIAMESAGCSECCPPYQYQGFIVGNGMEDLRSQLEFLGV